MSLNFNIEGFLEKFKKIGAADLLLKSDIKEVVFSIAGVKLEERFINIKGNNIYINCTPLVKNKIFLYKGKILSEISKKSRKKFIDIR